MKRDIFLLIIVGLVLLAFVGAGCLADTDQDEGEGCNMQRDGCEFKFEYDPNARYETVDDMLKMEPYRLRCSPKRLTGEVERELDCGYGPQTMKCKTGYAVYSLTNESCVICF